MIWVLLEITLPLCLAFLFGLGAGWLFWRWRRRSITQAEWDAKTQTGNTSTLKHKAIQEASEAYKRRVEKLDKEVAEKTTELTHAAKVLAEANEEITKLKNAARSAAPRTVVSDAVSGNTQGVTEADAQNNQQQTKIQELEFRSSNLQKTVEEQANELKEAHKHIDKIKHDLESADSRLQPTQPATSPEDLKNLQAQLSSAIKDKEELQKNIDCALAETKLHKNSVEEYRAQSAIHEQTIERQADELLDARKNITVVTAEVESLQAQLKSIDTENEQALLDQRGLLEQAECEKHKSEEALYNQLAELEKMQLAMENLETIVAKQSDELKATDTKSEQLADELKSALKQNESISARAEELSKLNQQLQDKLKLSDTEVDERDAGIKRIEELERKLAATHQINQELEQTKSQLEASQQKFSNYQASVIANRQTREEQLNSLRTRIKRQQEALELTRGKLENENTNKQKLQQLELQVEQARTYAEELGQAKANITSLNKQLDQTRLELARHNDTGTEKTRLQYEKLSAQNSELIQQLEKSKQESQEFKSANDKIAELTTQLNNARARNNQLSIKLENTSSAVTPIGVAQIKRLKAEIAEKDSNIVKLTKKLELKSEKTKKPKTKSKPAWHKGQTRVGTPGCEQKDDLTVINGIGPKIEKVLNKLGITSLIQIASLKSSDIKRVDEALVDFSGRIQRDEWVPQARAIIKSSKQSTNKSTKPVESKKAKVLTAKTTKNSWQKGETKFGTPGSIHKDDLKVINGIGPVIEKTLNRHGIKSWEQLAHLKVKEVKNIDEALDFPGRITREEWVAQAKALVKQYPDRRLRPDRRTFLNQAASSR